MTGRALIVLRPVPANSIFSLFPTRGGLQLAPGKSGTPPQGLSYFTFEHANYNVFYGAITGICKR
jgi:hypothetical protein